MDNSTHSTPKLNETRIGSMVMYGDQTIGFRNTLTVSYYTNVIGKLLDRKRGAPGPTYIGYQTIRTFAILRLTIVQNNLWNLEVHRHGVRT